MMTRTKQLDSLRETVAGVVRRGGKVLVVGWKPSNHNNFSEKLSAAKIVVFPKRIPDGISEHDFVLFTKFTGHWQQEKVRKKTSHFTPYALGIGEVRTVLEALEQFLPSMATTTQIKEDERIATVSRSTPETDENKLLQDKNIKPTLDPVTAFAKDFAREVGNDPEKSLSRYAAARILRRHFGEKAKPSKFTDLLRPAVEGQKRVGSYKATVKLLELATNRDEPTDPLEKIRWLIANEATYRERLLILERELEEVRGSLERISTAKKLLAELGRI